MTIENYKNGILLKDQKNFDPFDCFECGQCFRFERLSDSAYSLCANGRKLVVKKENGCIFFEDMTEEEFYSVWKDYFDLDRDYGKIIESFSFDKTVKRAAECASGIRILRQDPWETLVSFIISQNNNIPRIKKIIESMCSLLGKKGRDCFLFPTPEAIYEAGIDGLAPIKSGFRAKYIVSAAEKALYGEVSAERIKKGTYEEGMEELKKIKGVGDKVANCVLLFGFGFLGAFPIDVWVKKIIEKYYGGNFDPSSLGEYAGIAQQYLFYYERTLKDRL